jgi:hypothetical protein
MAVIVDDSLKLIIHFSSDYDIFLDQNFEKNNAHALSVLDIMGFGISAPLFTHIVGI